MLPDEVVVVAVTELSVVVVISPVVVDSVTPDNTVITSRSMAQSITFLPDVVLVGPAVPDPEQASWSLSDKLTMLG